ncbi:hypothetical protein QNA08_16660 [Chelatococcus sp. SYSU_G07232]|uniref:Uncharacterized protein n=1 Tax=Chelatococcus albus TaxID=3047466 RepID=A0ABT7AKF9_9HYPH|nr:hypothetical protein [Chelatococcus sp. SYSU_G07232]MDJ1159853.1 hypothetical protein [Chelatococcus sp. SYSU_G07232]
MSTLPQTKIDTLVALRGRLDKRAEEIRRELAPIGTRLISPPAAGIDDIALLIETEAAIIDALVALGKAPDAV